MLKIQGKLRKTCSLHSEFSSFKSIIISIDFKSEKGWAEGQRKNVLGQNCCITLLSMKGF